MNRKLDPVDEKGAKKKDPYELSDEDRQRILERARRELPELDRQFWEAMGTPNPYTVDEKSAKEAPYELSDEDRQRILERARRELPELDRQFKESMEDRRRIISGRRPLR